MTPEELALVPVTWPHLVSARQFTADNLAIIFDRADEMLAALRRVNGNFRKWPRQFSHAGESMLVFMAEASTRTGTSFCLAVNYLRANAIYTPNAETASSLAKGESADMMHRMFRQYHPAAVIARTSRESEPLTAARLYSAYSGTNPDKVRYTTYINAGSGAGEHPTQALLDLYTMREKRNGDLSGISMLIAGDVGYSRTINSLTIAMSVACPGLHLKIAAPVIGGRQFGPPEEVLQQLLSRQVDFTVEPVECHADIERLARQVEFGYWTRPQLERHSAIGLPEDFAEQTVERIRLTTGMLDGGMRAFHPLPHREEVDADVIWHPNALFEAQADRGVPVRMAVIDLCIREPERLTGGEIL